MLVARLSQRLEKQAPGVSLVIRPSTRLDLAEQIDVGRIDLAIGVFAQVPQRLQSQTLATLPEVLVMRKAHPAARRRMTLAELGRYPLLTISVGGNEDGAVDGASSNVAWPGNPKCSTVTHSRKRWAAPA